MIRKDLIVKELKFNIKYLLNRKEFYFALFVAFAINLIHVFLCVHESLRLNQFFEELYTGEYQFILYNANVNLHALIFVIFPIICSMILSDSNLMENKLKTTNMLITRINFKKNILIRVLLCIIITFIICFFSFLFNYIVLIIIFGTGNTVVFTQGVAFHLEQLPGFFLDNIRLQNPVIFAILINLCVSLIYGLLSAISYAVSFFVKNRIIIYFVPLIFLILTELLLYSIGLEGLSFLAILQPFGKFNIGTYAICVGILLVIIISLVSIRLFKKDVLV